MGKKPLLTYVVVDYDYMKATHQGVAAKVDAQIKAFRNADIDAEIVSIDTPKDALSKVMKRMPFCKDVIAWDDVVFRASDYLYIRRPQAVTKGFLKALQKWGNSNPAMKVIYEVPTFPYDAEDRTLKQWPLHIKDLCHRRKLKRYVDRAVNLAGFDEVFGIPSLHMMNGIDLDGLTKRKPSHSDEVLEMVCVASFADWHGVDRLLEGLGIYVRAGASRRILLHLVGGGDPAVMKRLQDMAIAYDLEKDIVFHGLCDRPAMDAVFDRCSLAVEVLGGHRKDNTLSSSLKSREYLGKGIPFIYSGEVDVFKREPVDFCLQLPSDDSPVNMDKVVKFYDDLYGRESEDQLIDRIRRYAQDNVAIEVAMKDVVDYIKRNDGDIDE